MSKYEYCAIKQNLEGEKKTKLKFLDAEGNHKFTEISDIQRNIAQLGMNGWEMVSFSEISHPSARVYYFKKKL